MKKITLFIFLSLLISLMVNSCDQKQEQTLEKKQRRTAPKGMISFSNYLWKINVDSNIIKSHPSPVFVDDNDFLHLKIIKIDTGWVGCEIISDTVFGYGDFVFYTATKFDEMEKNVIVSLTGLNLNAATKEDLSELGVRFSFWGMAENKNSLQYYITPYDANEKKAKYSYPPEPLTMKGAWSTHTFGVKDSEIKFASYHDHGNPTQWVINKFSLKKEQNKTAKETDIQFLNPGNQMKISISLKLIGNAPANQKEVELMLKKFEFVPQK